MVCRKRKRTVAVDVAGFAVMVAVFEATAVDVEVVMTSTSSVHFTLCGYCAGLTVGVAPK